MHRVRIYCGFWWGKFCRSPEWRRWRSVSVEQEDQRQKLQSRKWVDAAATRNLKRSWKLSNPVNHVVLHVRGWAAAVCLLVQNYPFSSICRRHLRVPPSRVPASRNSLWLMEWLWHPNIFWHLLHLCRWLRTLTFNWLWFRVTGEYF